MKEKNLIPAERILQKIFLIRGQKVMFDRDLAVLYGVETKVLNHAVKRNIRRFPADFMFQLTKEEMKNWKSQIVTSNHDKMGLRKASSVFTEHGVLMISKYKDLKEKIEGIEKKYDSRFKVVFDTLKHLLKEEGKPKNKIGFSEK